MNELVSPIAAVIVTGVLVYHEVRRRLKRVERDIIKNTTSTSNKINGWLETLLKTLPYCAWVKVVQRNHDGTVSFVMQYCNPLYEERYDKKLAAYIGKTDFDVWPYDVATDLYKNDAFILSTKGHATVLETLNGEELEYEKIYMERNGVEAIVGFLRPPVKETRNDKPSD